MDPIQILLSFLAFVVGFIMFGRFGVFAFFADLFFEPKVSKVSRHDEAVRRLERKGRKVRYMKDKGNYWYRLIDRRGRFFDGSAKYPWSKYSQGMGFSTPEHMLKFFDYTEYLKLPPEDPND